MSDKDTIYRQAAIDAVKTYWKKVVEDIPKGVGVKELTQLCNMALEHNANILKAIDQLPSAQPERTCVNCGKTINNGGWYADGRTRCPIEEHYALPKDGYCHLWEKRSVTDDDYPERREDERHES